MRGHFVRTYELWRKSGGLDEYGEPLPAAWGKLADVPGRAYPLNMKDGLSIGVQFSEVLWTFACPSDVDIHAGDQIRFDGRVLDVAAVSVTSSGQRIEARCKEIT